MILNSHEDSCDGLIILPSIPKPIHVSFPKVTLELLKSQQAMLKELLGRCSVRVRGESASTRLFGHKEVFGAKTTKECFEDLLAWLLTHIACPVYQVLESVSGHIISLLVN